MTLLKCKEKLVVTRIPADSCFDHSLFCDHLVTKQSPISEGVFYHTIDCR